VRARPSVEPLVTPNSASAASKNLHLPDTDNLEAVEPPVDQIQKHLERPREARDQSNSMEARRIHSGAGSTHGSQRLDRFGKRLTKKKNNNACRRPGQLKLTGPASAIWIAP
jgi:hypothetical protein